MDESGIRAALDRHWAASDANDFAKITHTINGPGMKGEAVRLGYWYLLEKLLS